MTIKETNDFMERIKQHYQEFVIDDYKIEEWYKELKDYDYQEVNAKLEEHLRNEQYGTSIPKVYFLTKYLTKEKDKNKYNTSNIIVRCQICGKKIRMNLYDKHYERCSSVEYLDIQSRRLYNKNLDKQKLRDMPDDSFNKIYNKVLVDLLETTDDKEEIDRINNYMIGNKLC